jgi:hypothetical protein
MTRRPFRSPFSTYAGTFARPAAKLDLVPRTFRITSPNPGIPAQAGSGQLYLHPATDSLSIRFQSEIAILVPGGGPWPISILGRYIQTCMMAAAA